MAASFDVCRKYNSMKVHYQTEGQDDQRAQEENAHIRVNREDIGENQNKEIHLLPITMIKTIYKIRRSYKLSKPQLHPLLLYLKLLLRLLS